MRELAMVIAIAVLGISADTPERPEWPQVTRCGHVVQPEDLDR